MSLKVASGSSQPGEVVEQQPAQIAWPAAKISA
jgi:hypothetical protein